MLPNEISYAVDVAMNDVDVTTVCRRSDYVGGKSLYKLPGHTASSRNQLQFFRNEPKNTGNFRGTRRTSAKLTREISVPGVDATTSVVVPIIIELSCSFPLGVSDSDAIAARQFIAAVLADGPNIDLLTLSLEV